MKRKLLIFILMIFTLMVSSCGISKNTATDKEESQNVVYTDNDRYTLAIKRVEEYSSKEMYASAMDVLDMLDTSTFNSEQIKEIDRLKMELCKQMGLPAGEVSSPEQAIEFIKQKRTMDGSAEKDEYYGNEYSAQECSDGYLVKVRATKNTDEQSGYYVHKSNGYIEFVGCSSNNQELEQKMNERAIRK